MPRLFRRLPARASNRPARRDPAPAAPEAALPGSAPGAGSGPAAGELITCLYQALFARHPSLRSLFPASTEFQQARLEQAPWYLLEHLDRPDRIVETFAQPGRDHRKLGVRPARCAAFETALCEAPRVRAGGRWGTELDQAWVRMPRLGVTAMVQGVEAPR